MASRKNAYGLCDVCGFRYALRDLKRTSYNTYVCPTDYDGRYDIRNHPQNFSSKGGDDSSLRNTRPDPNLDRDLIWEDADINWEDLTGNWESVDYGDLN